MSIFLDSSNIDEINKYFKMGILRGVTTNPTILLKEGIKGDISTIKKSISDIAKLVNPLPVSVEVTTNDKADMISQAKDFAKIEKNVNIKIPFHGPNGETENLEVIHELENKHDIRINVTAMMSAQQCFLAALAGATYVSIFGGRVNNMGYNCVEEIKKIKKLLDEFNLKSQIIVGSTREVLNIVEWLCAGAHIVTATPDLIKGMIVHPYTKETVKQFLQDAKKIESDIPVK